MIQFISDVELKRGVTPFHKQRVGGWAAFTLGREKWGAISESFHCISSPRFPAQSLNPPESADTLTGSGGLLPDSAQRLLCMVGWSMLVMEAGQPSNRLSDIDHYYFDLCKNGLVKFKSMHYNQFVCQITLILHFFIFAACVQAVWPDVSCHLSSIAYYHFV